MLQNVIVLNKANLEPSFFKVCAVCHVTIYILSILAPLLPVYGSCPVLSTTCPSSPCTDITVSVWKICDIVPLLRSPEAVLSQSYGLS